MHIDLCLNPAQAFSQLAAMFRRQEQTCVTEDSCRYEPLRHLSAMLTRSQHVLTGTCQHMCRCWTALTLFLTRNEKGWEIQPSWHACFLYCGQKLPWAEDILAVMLLFDLFSASTKIWDADTAPFPVLLLVMVGVGIENGQKGQTAQQHSCSQAWRHECLLPSNCVVQNAICTEQAR